MNTHAAPTVVFIDDDENLTRNIYRVLLEREGYRVLSEKNGLRGLELLENEPLSPDLVLVDCSMPEMNGEAFLTRLKEKLPRIFLESRVVGFTSYDPQSSAFQRIKKLAFDCREKPFDLDGILRIVSDYIRKPTDRECA